jgi:hypothetical protein
MQVNQLSAATFSFLNIALSNKETNKQTKKQTKKYV